MSSTIPSTSFLQGAAARRKMIAMVNLGLFSPLVVPFIIAKFVDLNPLTPIWFHILLRCLIIFGAAICTHYTVKLLRRDRRSNIIRGDVALRFAAVTGMCIWGSIGLMAVCEILASLIHQQ